MAAGAGAYSPRAGVLATVFRCSGTAVSRVLRTADFWVFYGIFIFFFGVFKVGMAEYYLGDEGELDFLKYDWKACVRWDQLEIVLYICTFSSVFFLWQCSQLYLELHELMRRMLSDAYDSAYLLRSYVQPSGCPPYDRVACRWLVTTVLLFFNEARHGCVDQSGWDRLVEFKLVGKEEADFLSELTDGQRFLVMMHCVADVAKTGLQVAGVPPNVESDVIRRLLQYGNSRSTLMETLRNPIPYPYFHLMKFMIMITLFLWGFGAATTDCWFAPLRISSWSPSSWA
ncbi:unnamed protein product [Prorocentrum cordatum]|uniref:Autophagy-related protein 9 n=1 Tax=Prorocentrum cordatum TaxID=2364126 RepID=A0ABN9UUZ8_9DINO|nr:unnamed protein product [Polarella glacialis]